MVIKRNKTIRLSITLVLIVIALGMTYVSSQQINPASKEDPSILISKKQFVCSMHPEIIKDEPGDCPICEMSLIEKIELDKNSADSLLNDIVRSVNETVPGSVTTVSPFYAKIPVIIEASGIINYDSRKIRTVSARFGGVVERSFVKYQFQPIRKGQKIFEIYCPDIYTERWNYIRLIQAYPDRDDLTVEAREWLNLLGLTAGQIDSLKRAVKPNYHLPVYSDVNGFAVGSDFDPEKYYSGAGQSIGNSLGFNDGVTIEIGDPLFKIIDINSLRADIKVKTEDVWILRKGQKVIFTVPASIDEKFEAIISQIEPLNGGQFQLVKVYFTNKKGYLLPGCQIQAHIQAGNHEALWLSKTAVLNLGKQKAAFVKHDSKFIATTIKTGLISGDNIEILSGVNQSSKIALDGLLLTDSDGFILTSSQ